MSNNFSCQNVQVMTAWKYSLFYLFYFFKIGSILLSSWMDWSKLLSHGGSEDKSFQAMW